MSDDCWKVKVVEGLLTTGGSWGGGGRGWETGGYRPTLKRFYFSPEGSGYGARCGSKALRGAVHLILLKLPQGQLASHDETSVHTKIYVCA